jgi:hypothetical protein
MGTRPQPPVEPRVLRIFVSYASEDLPIAKAVAMGFRDSLPVGHADVCFDKWFLEAGIQFKQQIEAKLESTDVFVIVYTGLDKLFAGWELGFFEGVIRNDPKRKRRIVPVYLEHLPSAASEYEGRALRLSPDLLELTLEEFRAKNIIGKDDPMCVLIEELQEEVEEIKELAHFPKTPPHDRPDPVECVRNMRLGIFGYLKTTVRQVTKPQKEITIKTTGAAMQTSANGLPDDALLVPKSGNPMSIFGLADAEMSWEKFLALTSNNVQRDAWRAAISGVVNSSQAERIDVDNNQLIPSSDESKIYRIILTTATRRWNDCQEFNLYFVEAYREEEFGNKDTTLTLKGLEAACRFRFMFLEDRSQFSANRIMATHDEDIREMAAKLLRELNLMKAKSMAGLSDPGFWSQFGGWDLIYEISNLYRPKEAAIRELIGEILVCRDRSQLAALREKLATVIGELEDGTRSANSALIAAMAKALQQLVKSKPDAIELRPTA